MRANNFTVDPRGRVSVDLGLAAGLSFFDGAIAVGYGGLFYDQSDFQGILERRRNDADFQDGFWYINIQSISLIKSAFKNFGKR